MNKTPEEARKIVADALRSGEYTQGEGYLEETKDGKTYNCCLGVACREYMKYEDNLKVESKPGYRDVIFDGTSTYLPDVVREWLGFSSDEGDIEIENHSVFIKKKLQDVKYLTQLNDEGATFEEIAGLFENPPEGLLDATG